MSIRRQKKNLCSKIEIIEGDHEDELKVEYLKELQDNELNKYKSRSDYYIKKGYKCVIYCCNFTSRTICVFMKVSGIYFLWIFLHYIASHLYIKLCVPKTFIGFVLSPFMTATPHCQGLRWIVYNAANMINNMWIMLGAWICSTILIVNKNNTNIHK